MNPKFSIGQTVKFIGDPPSEKGDVTSISFYGTTYTYQITATSFDNDTKQLLHGVKTLHEDEMEAV